MALNKLLGDTLISDSGNVSTKELAGEGKVLGIYFSAHWCPPCRAFTPQLASFYNKWKKGEKKDLLNIVFVSSDRDQDSFNEYFEEMPWLALPYSERERKKDLSRKFKVSGIPTLVFVEAATGKLITSEGRRIISQDPEGENFPWRPKPVKEILAGTYIRSNGDKVNSEDFDGCVLGIYFSAHWCPPCRSFTPQLVKTYNKLRADGKKVEIIFCSSDRDEHSFKEYFGTMPWLSIPFGNKQKTEEISNLFQVSGIPKLVWLDESRKIITEEGRGAVSSDPEGEDFPWIPKPLNILTDRFGRHLNEDQCLVYLTDGSGSGVAVAKEMLGPIADENWATSEEDDRIYFFITTPDEDITKSVADFLKLSSQRPQVLLLDCAGQVWYQLSSDNPSPDDISKFLTDFKDGKLPPKKLK